MAELRPGPITNPILRSSKRIAWLRENSCKYTYEELMTRFNLTTGTLRWAIKRLNLSYKVKSSSILKSPSKVKWLKTNSHKHTVAQMKNIMLTDRNVLRAALKRLGLKYLTLKTVWSEKEEIFALRKQGTSFTEISDTVGLSERSCKELCKDFDITPLSSLEEQR